MEQVLRTRTSLFCGALALAIAVSMLLRGRRRSHLLFACFAADIGLWYLAQWLYHFVQADVWARFTALLATFLPQFALHLFDAVVPEPGRRSTLLRVAGVLLVPMLVLVLSPQHQHGLVRVAIFLYVFGLIAAGLAALLRRAERSGSRETRRRVRFLVLIGALAASFSLADFLWFVGAPLPPVGAVLAIVFLFLLSESLTRARLVDLYDIVVQLLVSTALAFCLAGIFYVFVVLVGGFDTMYLNAVLAAIVILVLFEPLRDRVQRYAHRALFRERVDIERAVTAARAELTHVLGADVMAAVVLTHLEASRRATAGAVYLRLPGASDFELAGAFGPEPPRRIEGGAVRAILDRLEATGSLSLETFSAGTLPERALGSPEVEPDGRVLAAAAAFGPLSRAVCIPLRGEGSATLGLLLVADDRVRDAFSPEEIKLLEGLAAPMAVVIENSRRYRLMQERDRLAALGQMAAGLAHEVKNPLGAIKGAAQLLADPSASRLDPGSREFVDIILEEVDRLDRVVGSVLDYARPAKGSPGEVDVNTVVQHTLRLMAAEPLSVTPVLHLDPGRLLVTADAEHLKQVLINLIRNATQAMGGSGEVSIGTRRRAPAGEAGVPEVEITVADRGPGIAPQVLQNLFVPFFTTKPQGTGLGLAVSQRLVQAMGGRIEVASRPGSGTTFSVVLPEAPGLPPAGEGPSAGTSLPAPAVTEVPLA